MGIPVYIGLIVLIVLWIINIYNRLVRFRYNRQNAFTDIDVRLKQRRDLVLQPVETVKGYLSRERELLTGITETRSAVMPVTTISLPKQFVQNS